ncbi:MAG: DMT family transporter [Dictyoglomi bacterium]|nr:DMT family transporter [Dictyoglomota bacterium]
MLFLLLATFFWGITFPIQKIVLDANVSPFVYNTLRFFVASAVVFILWGPGNFKYGSILGVILAISYLAQTWGLSLTTSSRSGFITALFVIFVPFFSYLIEKKKPTVYHVIAFIVAMVGILLLTHGEVGFGLGEFLTLICAILFGLHVVLITVFSRIVKEEHLLFWQFFMVWFVNGIVALMAGHSFAVSLRTWGVAIFAALTATVYGIWAQLKYQKVVSSNTSALIFTMEPVFAYIFSYLILGEVLTPTQWIGAMLLLGSTIMVSVMQASK